MTIYIHSAPDEAWYNTLVGCTLENVYIGYTGCFHVHEDIFGVNGNTHNRDISLSLLWVNPTDAHIIDGRT